ncbi:magnesium chelatase subunit D [Chelativorans sp. ZYF759]|uniref:magnesium chelatase subunit D n=1 Tax=Chelativorans sp. ZYF759 TaxID=2692213 RepID=UPI00145F48FD|nr:magnesium chelatase subunit D [Chelativorans sp. ZYF759]NMG41852.1 magnesium chelatase subunit D [Chelativorans sp. ZYF759]
MNASHPGPWHDALLAAQLLAIDPMGLGGIRVRARAGPVREAWLRWVRELFPPGASFSRVAASPDEASLVGGLDFSATLATGKPVMRFGLLAAVDGGVLVLAMAERTSASCAALIAAAMDCGLVKVEREGFSSDLQARFGLIALDEGIEDDETIPAALADRLGLSIRLEEIGYRDIGSEKCDRHAVIAAQARVNAVAVADDIVAALVGLALASGWSSVRGSLFLLRAARAVAALRGADEIAVEDAATAARLALGPQRLAEAVAAPQEKEPPQPEQAPPEEGRAEDSRGELQDIVLQAAAAQLPDGLLAAMLANKVRMAADRGGGSGRTAASAKRGRPLAPIASPRRAGVRLDILATLRAAAPWQGLRGRAKDETLRIRMSDLRNKRYAERRGATAIFAVDASGSAAVARLAEAKGAVQLLLAECYVRRDEVALIAYRRTQAEVLLEPTRSLARARKMLSALPGGGGTPLAAGIIAAARLARAQDKRGRDAITIFLTDGRANVALDGAGGRDRAMSDMREAARRFRGMALRSIVIDTGGRPQPAVAALANELGAEYVPLPRGGAGRISAVLSERMKG